MVSSPDNRGVMIVGGKKGEEPYSMSTKILELRVDGNEWQELDQQLAYPRADIGYSVIPIPESMATCQEPAYDLGSFGRLIQEYFVK